MRELDVRSADEMRQRIAAGAHDRAAFRTALVAAEARDAWIDRVLGVGAPPDDGPELPRGGVAYLPCAVDPLIEIVDRAQIGPSDVFVDVGAGVGRAMRIVQLLTGAEVIGIEIQSALVRAALVPIVHGDALEADLTRGTVFFLYCPFSGERLQRFLDKLAAIAHPIRVCCVDLPLPECNWLDELAPGIFRSRTPAADRP